jgi:hypothetical protein
MPNQCEKQSKLITNLSDPMFNTLQWIDQNQIVVVDREEGRDFFRIKIFNSTSGRILRQYRLPTEDLIQGISYSLDGKRVAMGQINPERTGFALFIATLAQGKWIQTLYDETSPLKPMFWFTIPDH